jgi:serine/threonine protein kinase
VTTTVPAPLGAVAHYNLLEQLPASGPGDLFRARDTKLGRTVTLRLLAADYASTQAEGMEIVDTARALSAISHPNVTTIFDAGLHNGRIYLAFEFLKGQSLRAEMGGRPLSVRRAVETAIQISDALANAHAAGFLHGGLSPESVALTAKGHAKIPVFELAALSGFDRTETGYRLRDYDSPEEARGQSPDDRSDVYSAGAILFEMLTGRRPMHRGAAAASASNPHVSKELDALVLKVLSPSPEARHQTAAALAADLRRVLVTIDARGGAGDEHTPALPAARGRQSVVVAVLALLLAGVAWFAWRALA